MKYLVRKYSVSVNLYPSGNKSKVVADQPTVRYLHAIATPTFRARYSEQIPPNTGRNQQMAELCLY